MNPLQAIDVPAGLRRMTPAQLRILAQQARASPSAPAVELALALGYVFDAPRDRIVWDGSDTAHPATALAAAYGVARALRLQGVQAHAVAVIGIDALGAGMAFEALNNAGVQSDARLLVVLNDGALPGPAPPPAAICDAVGLPYAGPVDGHDLDMLIPTLDDLRRRTGPHLLHVVTRTAGATATADADGIDDWLCDLALAEPRLVAVTPARRGTPGLVRFAQAFPDRYFDAGPADQHAVTFAAGLAAEGLKPVVTLPSTSLQRAYDQLIHDVALQRLDVTFALGAGAFDSAFLRCIPNLLSLAPSDAGECRRMLALACRHAGPAAVRIPCGMRPDAGTGAGMDGVAIGRGLVRRTGVGTAILAFGSMVAAGLAAGRMLDATVVDMRFIKPLDTDLVLRLARGHDRLVTVEDGAATGGAGAAVAEALAAQGVAVPLAILGPHDADGIVQAIRRRFPPGRERQVANDG
ncbi:MAG: 1-deoxy-D-xylulose-5-phosphate synthase [Massilia sp.]|nr:1-deoxy-D-xylulose-5-phosphate synthase [Massilia sp.]